MQDHQTKPKKYKHKQFAYQNFVFILTNTTNMFQQKKKRNVLYNPCIMHNLLNIGPSDN